MSETYGFELLRDEEITELHTRARLYRHTRTGAELLSLENDDENKSFGVTFRTPPSDSTGVAHILEHSVLCGSRKYPVKKPFFELVKSSVKTFLNAMTYPDKTVYPVASTNLKDFYNLVDVYLDAVFFPKIGPEVLKQEGWHYQLDSVDAPLRYGGVVFNEMKGQYSSPDYVLYRSAQAALLPDTTYAVSSGGDPKYIPDLTYEDFKRFHTTLYHPSNARLFFAGDDDPQERLRLLDAYLSQFEPISPPSQVVTQPRFSAPREIEHTYAAPADAGPKKGMVTIGWLIGAETDLERVLAFEILADILVGNAAAPLRKALIDSGLGDDLTGSGYNDSAVEHTFAVGMKGIDPANAPKVEQLVLDTLRRLADEGIDPDAITASLNSTEFALRENNTGAAPRGLVLLFRSLSTWLYDGDPIAPLRFEAPLANLRAAIARGEKVFENLIRSALLENTHRSRTLLRPDAEQAERESAEELARLEQVRAAMSLAEREALVRETAELRRLQEQPDQPADLAKIPTLRLGDLDRQGKNIPSEELRLGTTPLLFHDLPTNGIVYLDMTFDLRALPTDLLPLAPLFARALTEMGTEREDYVRLIQRIDRETGGISAGTFAANHIQSSAPLGSLMLRGKAILAKTDELLNILGDLLLHTCLDNRERFRQIVTRARAGRESSLVPSGNAYARLRAAAQLSEADWASEQMGGIANLFYLRDLEKRVEADWPGVLAQLEQVRSHLVNRRGLLLNLTSDSATHQQIGGLLEEFVAALPEADYVPAAWQRSPARREGLLIPAKVNYVARVANLYDLGLEMGGASSVVLRYLNIAYFLEKIRVQGGAYGAGAGFDRSTGLLAFTSYRDPHLLRTLGVYDGTGAHLREVVLDATAIERSAIGTIGDMDGYQLPDAKGYSAMIRHLTGVSDEYRQHIREQIFAVSAADFLAFADLTDAARDHGTLAVVGSSEAINAANQERPDLLEPVKVL